MTDKTETTDFLSDESILEAAAEIACEDVSSGWSSLVSNDDAFKLMLAMNMTVECKDEYVVVHIDDELDDERLPPVAIVFTSLIHSEAAVRRAITIGAAMIRDAYNRIKPCTI